MGGTLLSYFDGYLRVAFSRAWHGDVYIDFHLHGDAIAAIPVDDQWQKGEPELLAEKDVSLRVWTSSSVSSFFTELVRWLEAITCSVGECAFFWDGEGPDGELHWMRGQDGSGYIRISWTGSSHLKSAPFVHEVRLNTAQMVRTLYEGFRSHVTSNRFDRLEYESLNVGEVFSLVFDESDLEVLADALAERGRVEACRLIDAMMDLAYDSKAGYPRRASLAAFSERARLPEQGSDKKQQDAGEDSGRWLDLQWDGWNKKQRREYVLEDLYPRQAGLGYGERVFELRSLLVENWLEKQAAKEHAQPLGCRE